MNTYDDVYEPFNRTRFILLILLLCVTVFYYSTQSFVVQADNDTNDTCISRTEACDDAMKDM